MGVRACVVYCCCVVAAADALASRVQFVWISHLNRGERNFGTLSAAVPRALPSACSLNLNASLRFKRGSGWAPLFLPGLAAGHVGGGTCRSAFVLYCACHR